MPEPDAEHDHDVQRVERHVGDRRDDAERDHRREHARERDRERQAGRDDAAEHDRHDDQRDRQRDELGALRVLLGAFRELAVDRAARRRRAPSARRCRAAIASTASTASLFRFVVRVRARARLRCRRPRRRRSGRAAPTRRRAPPRARAIVASGTGAPSTIAATDAPCGASSWSRFQTCSDSNDFGLSRSPSSEREQRARGRRSRAIIDEHPGEDDETRTPERERSEPLKHASERAPIPREKSSGASGRSGTSTRGRTHDTGLVRVDDGVHPIAEAELHQHPADVRLHRRLRHDERLADLRVVGTADR